MARRGVGVRPGTWTGPASTRRVFTVGNGRIGTRGSLEEGHRGQLSGTFLNGVYDGHDVPVIDLVNAPDWLDTAVFAGGVRLDVDTCSVVAHHRTLDLRDGLLRRATVFEDGDGRRTRLETVRCASMADRRVCALRVEIHHRSTGPCGSAASGSRRRRCTGGDPPAGQAGGDLHVERPGGLHGRDTVRPLPGGPGRASGGGRVRLGRRPEPCRVAAAVGRVRLRCRRRCALHPGSPHLRLPAADRRQPGRPDGEHF